MPRQDKICTMCQQSSSIFEDEEHLLFDCSALQDSRDRNRSLFQAPQCDAMTLFMWQDDIIAIGVACFIDVCIERVYTATGPPAGDQASD